MIAGPPLASTLVMFLLYSLACIGAGFFILYSARRSFSPLDLHEPLIMGVTAFAAGQGLLAGIWTLLALVGFFTPALVMGVVIFTSLAACCSLFKSAASLKTCLRNLFSDFMHETLVWKTLIIGTTLLILAGLTTVASPLDGDAMAYYMALPKTMAFAHRLIPLSDYEAFMSIGISGETHYAALMALGVPGAVPRLFAWPTGVACALLIAAICARAGIDRRGQWLTLIMVYTSSAFIYLQGSGKVDMFAALLGVGAFYWALRIADKGSGALLLAGWLGGCAVVAKVSYIVTLVPGLALLLLWPRMTLLGRSIVQKETKVLFSLISTVMRQGLIMGLGALAAVLPHLIKNGVLFNNPFAPFLGEGSSWAAQVWFSPETTLRLVATYPFALTLGQYWGQFGNISWLVLAFVPLALFLPRPTSWTKSTLAAISASSLLGLILWVALNPSVVAPRYFLATLLVLIPVAAAGASQVLRAERGPRIASSAVISALVVTMLASFLYNLGIYGTPGYYPGHAFRYLLGIKGEQEQVGSVPGILLGQEAVNLDASPDSRVFAFSYYKYWLRPDLILCMNSSEERRNFNQLETYEQKWKFLRERKFRYVYADQPVTDLDLLNPPEWVRVVQLDTGGGGTFAWRLDYL